MLSVDSFMPEVQSTTGVETPIEVDIHEFNMGKPKPSDSMLCESCRNQLDTASVPCTCSKSPEVLAHSTPIRENKENQKKEKCVIKMVECGAAKANDADDIETERPQKAESNQKAGLQCSEAPVTILPMQASQPDQPKEQGPDVELLQSGYNRSANEVPNVELLQTGHSRSADEVPNVELLQTGYKRLADEVPNVELLQTGYKRLADENRELKEKVEQLEKGNKRPEEDNLTVARSGGEDTDKKPVVIPLTYRKGRMEEKDRLKMIRKMPFLIEQLDPKHLIPTMFSKLLITEDEADELRTIQKSQGRGVCAEEMLFMLIRCGQYAYKIFLKCLELTGYRQVIEELEPRCEIFEGVIKYPDHKYLEMVDEKNPKRKEFIDMIETDIKQLDPGIELVVVITLESGCVQVTYHLISLGSKSESELREILEEKVKSGYIGDNKVSTKGFSFKKITGGDGEDMDIDTQEEEDQDSEKIKKLKRKFADLEEDNSRLRKQISELENKTKILKRKLEKGLPFVETTATNKDEFPLHHAALHATDVQEFKSVLEKQASGILQLDNDGHTPFDKACLSKYCPLEKVKLIVCKGYSEAETLVEICRSAPKSLLSLICCIPTKDELDESVIDAMTELRTQLMDNADIHARTRFDKTLLHFASEYCDIEAMTFLIRNGSDVRCIDTDGASPMFYSCKSGSDPVPKINLLEAYGAIIDHEPIFNKTLLHTACEFSTLEAVQYLTEQDRLDVNGLDSYGKSPLYYTCKSNKQPIEKIDFLISMGASLKCSTIDNYTLIHAACDYNTTEVVEHLIELGEDVDSEDMFRYTPLHCCCRSQIDPIEKIKKLADHGARFLIKFRREYIGIASQFDLTETVEFLKRSLPENAVPEAAGEGDNAMEVPVPVPVPVQTEQT